MRRNELQVWRAELIQAWTIKFDSVRATIEIREDQRQEKREYVLENLSKISNFFEALAKNIDEALESLTSDAEEFNPPEKWKDIFKEVKMPLKQIHAFSKNEFAYEFKQMKDLLNCVKKWESQLAV